MQLLVLMLLSGCAASPVTYEYEGRRAVRMTMPGRNDASMMAAAAEERPTNHRSPSMTDGRV